MENSESNQSNALLTEEIKARLASMERRLGGLITRLRATTPDEFITNDMLEEFTFARLYRATKDVVYLAGLVLTCEGETPPEQATERLNTLVNKDIISPALASDIQLVLSFFDVLANTNQEIDQKYLWDLAHNQSNSLIEFGCTVHTYIEQQAW